MSLALLESLLRRIGSDATAESITRTVLDSLSHARRTGSSTPPLDQLRQRIRSILSEEGITAFQQRERQARLPGMEQFEIPDVAKLDIWDRIVTSVARAREEFEGPATSGGLVRGEEPVIDPLTGKVLAPAVLKEGFRRTPALRQGGGVIPKGPIEEGGAIAVHQTRFSGEPPIDSAAFITSIASRAGEILKRDSGVSSREGSRVLQILDRELSRLRGEIAAETSLPAYPISMLPRFSEEETRLSTLSSKLSRINTAADSFTATGEVAPALAEAIPALAAALPAEPELARTFKVPSGKRFSLPALLRVLGDEITERLFPGNKVLPSMDSHTVRSTAIEIAERYGLLAQGQARRSDLKQLADRAAKIGEKAGLAERGFTRKERVPLIKEGITLLDELSASVTRSPDALMRVSAITRFLDAPMRVSAEIQAWTHALYERALAHSPYSEVRERLKRLVATELRATDADITSILPPDARPDLRISFTAEIAPFKQERGVEAALESARRVLGARRTLERGGKVIALPGAPGLSFERAAISDTRFTPGSILRVKEDRLAFRASGGGIKIGAIGPALHLNSLEGRDLVVLSTGKGFFRVIEEEPERVSEALLVAPFENGLVRSDLATLIEPRNVATVTSSSTLSRQKALAADTEVFASAGSNVVFKNVAERARARALTSAGEPLVALIHEPNGSFVQAWTPDGIDQALLAASPEATLEVITGRTPLEAVIRAEMSVREETANRVIRMIEASASPEAAERRVADLLTAAFGATTDPLDTSIRRASGTAMIKALRRRAPRGAPEENLGDLGLRLLKGGKIPSGATATGQAEIAASQLAELRQVWHKGFKEGSFEATREHPFFRILVERASLRTAARAPYQETAEAVVDDLIKQMEESSVEMLSPQFKMGTSPFDWARKIGTKLKQRIRALNIDPTTIRLHSLGEAELVGQLVPLTKPGRMRSRLVKVQEELALPRGFLGPSLKVEVSQAAKELTDEIAALRLRLRPLVPPKGEVSPNPQLHAELQQKISTLTARLAEETARTEIPGSSSSIGRVAISAERIGVRLAQGGEPVIERRSVWLVVDSSHLGFWRETARAEEAYTALDNRILKLALTMPGGPCKPT